MIRFIYLLVTTILISCNSSTNTSHKETGHTDSTQNTDALADSSTATSPTIDSTDKSNANTIALAKDDINKATVSLKDSFLLISSDKFRDHRFFGYSKPDIHSKRMILFSIFTNDVEGNPYHLPYGAYYQNSDMDSMQLKYFADEGVFAGFIILKNNTSKDTTYIEKKWIEFKK